MSVLYKIEFSGCFEKDTLLVGNRRDISGDFSGIRSAKECQKECRLNPRCKEFNFQETEPYKCLLKYAHMNKNKYADGCEYCKGWIYGPKNCNKGKCTPNIGKIIFYTLISLTSI